VAGAEKVHEAIFRNGVGAPLAGALHVVGLRRRETV
jgi:hypothetical protein